MPLSLLKLSVLCDHPGNIQNRASCLKSFACCFIKRGGVHEKYARAATGMRYRHVHEKCYCMVSITAIFSPRPSPPREMPHRVGRLLHFCSLGIHPVAVVMAEKSRKNDAENRRVTCYKNCRACRTGALRPSKSSVLARFLSHGW